MRELSNTGVAIIIAFCIGYAFGLFVSILTVVQLLTLWLGIFAALAAVSLLLLLDYYIRKLGDE